jgi:hypothetical protein
MQNYVIIDFNGELDYTELQDGSYAVDPLYEETFIEEKKGLPVDYNRKVYATKI